MKMFYFCVIIIFLIVVHIVDFLKGIFPDILKVNVTLRFLKAQLHLSVYTSKQFLNVFFLFASDIFLIFLLKLLFSFESAHSSFCNSFHRFFFVGLFILFLIFLLNLSFNSLEEMIYTGFLVSIVPFPPCAFLRFISLRAVCHSKQMILQFALIFISFGRHGLSIWL